MKLYIAADDREHAILIADEDSNDIAEFFHSDHATVGQSYETALALAQKLVTCDGAKRPTANAAALTEKLIQAAVDYEQGRCGQRELSDARAAVEAALMPDDAPDWQSAKVSIDVSTGDHDAGNRVFGRVVEWQPEDYVNDKPSGLRLLCQYESDNFGMHDVAQAVVVPELPAPAVAYADHSYPAYSKRQMQEYGQACALASQGGKHD